MSKGHEYTMLIRCKCGAQFRSGVSVAEGTSNFRKRCPGCGGWHSVETKLRTGRSDVQERKTREDYFSNIDALQTMAWAAATVASVIFIVFLANVQ